MEFVITEYKHCDLMEISGRIDSYSAPQIEQALQALITDDRSNIVIDMQNVSYISSSGILVFVNLQRRWGGIAESLLQPHLLPLQQVAVRMGGWRFVLAI